jgi:uncharacterized protein (TIGR02246 family)
MSVATDVVDTQVAAYQARDLERFIACYAEDASVVQFDGRPILVGRQALREHYGRLFADHPDMRLVIANRMAAGDFVVDEERLSGVHPGDAQSPMTALSVYKVTNGKIARLMILR